MHGLNPRQPLRRHPERVPRHVRHGGAAGVHQLIHQWLPARAAHKALPRVQGAADHQRIVQLVRAFGIGPRFLAHPVDGTLIERAQVVGLLYVEPATRDHRLGAALFQRRVVQERERLGVQDLVRQGRRLGRVARDEGELAVGQVL